MTEHLIEHFVEKRRQERICSAESADVPGTSCESTTLLDPSDDLTHVPNTSNVPARLPKPPLVVPCLPLILVTRFPHSKPTLRKSILTRRKVDAVPRETTQC